MSKKIYEDSSLLVIEKASGVLSHPNTGDSLVAGRERALFEGPYDADDRRFDTPEGPRWLIHRIDKETSGLVLAAKDAVTAKALVGLFEQGKIFKGYTALIKGQCPSRGEWRDVLSKEKRARFVRSSIGRGKDKPNAILNYTVKRYFRKERLSLLNIDLVTGKTHQIRVQAAHRHYPVCGDRVYGDFDLNRRLRPKGLKRLFLHASTLGFKHPATGKPLEVTSPLPEDLEEFLSRLR